jgi:predicted negative regulator of RcsB-dependent stress response
VVDIIEGYETEEQQVEAIKKWWKANGNTLIIAAVAGLAGLWGWRYYNESVISAQEAHSQAYADMQLQLETQEGEEELETIRAFIADNSDNNDGVMASLLLVKEAIAQKDYELAKTQLVQLQTQNSYQPLSAVINLRLARVQAELGEYDEALTTVDLVTAKQFLAKAYQIKGSVYLKQGKTEQARSAFQDAINASQGRGDPVLQLQFDDLALPETEAVAPLLDAEK